METAGVKGGNQVQTLQNRFRDAFRKRLRWRWDRDSGGSSGLGSNPTSSSSSHSPRDDTQSTAKRWPHFSPTTVRKFRSMFSGETSNTSLDGEAGTCNKDASDDMTPVSSNQPSEMVNTKTEEKKGEEMEKGSSSCSRGSPLSQEPQLQPLEELHISSENTDRTCSEPMMSCTTVLSQNASTSSTNNLAKASDNSNPSIPCIESESFKSDNLLVSTVEPLKGDDVSSSSCPNVLDVAQIFKSNQDTSIPRIIKAGESDLSEPLKKNSDEVGQCLAISSNSEETKRDVSCLPALFVKNTKKPPEPLCLNLEPGRTSPSLTRKSPVTVQEWVDSIPFSSQIIEDLETSGEEHNDVCPAVTVQPASSQSGTDADRRREAFSRDASPSLQSDTGSHGSSVDSYLEARKPDPEEVLLGLGFGGSVHTSEAEVSRIPSRFLQPSKVKGVEIDDFLRYQQDLIETFESGYSGYRGLIGGSQIPSVIVAKIMEKLREHERDSSVKSSAGSSPGHHGELTRRRFSRAVQRVSALTKMKSRDSISSSSPQPQTHSVLNPDNRKFLDNQGNKSPEISRKRMIIGHRSFTFDGDGQLIEGELNPGEDSSSCIAIPKPPPSARPLTHNDSMISSATSQSYDSESDPEEIGGHQKSSCRGNHLLQRLFSTPAVSSYSSGNPQDTEKQQIDYICETIASKLIQRRKSLPTTVGATPVVSMERNSSNEKSVDTSTTPVNNYNAIGDKVCQDKNCSSVSFPISTVPYTENDHGDGSPCMDGESYQNEKSSRGIFQRAVSVNEETPSQKIRGHSKNSSPQKSYYSSKFEEGPHHRISDFALPEDPDLLNLAELPCSFTSDGSSEQHIVRKGSFPKSSAMYLDRETRRQLSLTFSSDSCDLSPPVLTQRSRNGSTSSSSSWECDAFLPGSRSRNKSVGKADLAGSSILPSSTSSTRSSRRGSLKRQQNVEEEDCVSKILPESSISPNLVHLQALDEKPKGDSFEMEELGVEEEVLAPPTTRTGSAHSDSSGFQEVLFSSGGTRLCKQLSESEPLLPQSNLNVHVHTVDLEHLKRLSLPVIRIQDESGVLQWRASSVHNATRRPCNAISLRRSRSLPANLFRVWPGDSLSPGSISDSIGNMFSSCSDESVIHLPMDCGDKSPQVSNFPLLVALTDNSCEQGSGCATQNCCKHNVALKKSLGELNSSVAIALDCNAAWSCVNRDLQSLQEAQLKISNVVQHMEGHLCNLPECKMKTILEGVAQVAQYQSDVCNQLQKISSDAHRLARVFPMDSSNLLSSSQNPCLNSLELTHLMSCQLHHSDNMCQSLCKVIQEENRRLQDVVQQNACELAHIRKLLQNLLLDSKE